MTDVHRVTIGLSDGLNSILKEQANAEGRTLADHIVHILQAAADTSATVVVGDANETPDDDTMLAVE